MKLVAEAEAHGDLSEAARAAVVSGFGGGPDGEDDFDAMVGLLGILKYLRANSMIDAPPDPFVTSVEGWILGQTPVA